MGIEGSPFFQMANLLQGTFLTLRRGFGPAGEYSFSLKPLKEWNGSDRTLHRKDNNSICPPSLLRKPDISQFRDLVGMWVYHAVHDELKLPAELALQRAAEASRDRARTPLQWVNAPNGGFSPAGVETWLPVNPDYALGVNVADQEDDPHSLLNFYRQMLRLRKQTPALISGYYTSLHEEAADYLAFLRHVDADPFGGAGQTCLVALNFSEHSHTLSFNLKTRVARRRFSSSGRDGATDDMSRLDIGPFEAYVGELIS